MARRSGRVIGKTQKTRVGGEPSEAALRKAARQEMGAGETWENARGIEHAPFSPVPAPREMPNLRLHLLRRWMPGQPFEKLTYLMDNTIDPQYEISTLKTASLWWVKDDMIDLVCAAMENIPSDVKPNDLVLPAGQDVGFAVFQKSWVGIDAHTGDKNVKVQAMTWAPSIVQKERCISYSMYNYLDFGAGLSPRELQQAVEQQVIDESHAERLVQGPEGAVSGLLRGGAWVFMGRSDWPETEQLDSFHIEAKANPLTPNRRASLEEDRRFFSAFCALVNHRLSVEEVVHPQRQTRRQSERAGISVPSTVRYIRLREVTRKGSGDETEHKQVEWSHRWFSRGHMGYRWTGTKDKRVRKLVYVNPSIKGPADKPLIVKTEVRTWVR